ncbi:hypothetical protein AALP_AA2G021400 [Arabis alpina]|uniref:TIR domain-containing protein n=1 Tax=Arabis alpina TaxID=50452 RepID=A0A087HES8_ARAAL|nr:hypothetical protein AALP_AA2G021400 [Arabis alpina]
MQPKYSLGGRSRHRVFASFHGKDVRKTFLSHLRKQFDYNGISMFNDQGIQRSQTIPLALTQAIRGSRISIVVLSKNYASSSWCLDELLEIMKCKENMGQIVMTIFYGVDPSDVRKQKGDFGKVFKKTCARKTEEERRKWHKALTEVGNIAGEHFLNWDNEAKMIETVAKDVLDKLNVTSSRDFDGMVGLEAHLRKMESLLDLDYDGVKMVAISGPTGIGAIKENLCDQKVLIILDDVNNLKQLEALAKEPTWFGPGSRIIVTTENEELLQQHELCGSLPLGLRVVGSSLRGKEEDEWEDVVNRLETILDRDIEDVLRVGYDNLDENEQALFLHIAVFFNHKYSDLVRAMFTGCNLDVKRGLKILVYRSLIEISTNGNLIEMHRLLQEMARKAIRKQEPWKRQILMDAHEICDVLENETGTSVVSGISFDISEINEVVVSNKALKRMSNLQFLRIYKSRDDGNDTMYNIPEEMEFPRRLRLLEWKEYPSKCLPPTFHPEYLVELDMKHSKLEYLWQGTRKLTNLKKRDLSRSFHLKELPDLSNATNLEELNLTHCESLVEIPSSFRFTSVFSNSFSSSYVTPKDPNFTVSYLVDSLGLPTKLAESISKKVSFQDQRNPDSVLNLLRSHGFTDSQISTIVTDYPRLLLLDAERSIGPKLHFLQSRGASISELTKIVSLVPEILGKKSTSVYYDSVKCIVEAKNKKSSNYAQCSLENKVRNISVLRELGMPQRLLLPLLVSKSQPVCGKENFDASLKKVVEMGFDPTTSKFVLALRMLYQMSDKTIEEKVQVYKSLGFTVENIWEIFKLTPSFLKVSKNKILQSMETFLGLGFSRDEFAMMVKRYPACIEYSAESVKRKTEFILKKMNWPVKAVVLHPQVVGYSMEKRIVPRCNVIKALMSKGLLREGSELPPVSSVMSSTDQTFLNRYVLKHDKLVPELMAIFTGKRVSETRSRSHNNEKC